MVEVKGAVHCFVFNGMKFKEEKKTRTAMRKNEPQEQVIFKLQLVIYTIKSELEKRKGVIK